ncbi:MAG: zinc-binding dehydrogenase [Anaerolineaceae bacterium]|nr:zinc-binding dehydrogenase [Anaerolineaceae bacterium]
MPPEKMKAVVISEKNKAEVRVLTTPVPVSGEVLIRLKHCMICTWERRIFSGQDLALPFVPGHEVSGEVVAIPEGTLTNLVVGQKVVVKTFDSCGECEFCRRGLDNLCKGKSKKRNYDGIPGSGGLAQYIAIASDRVYPLENQEVDLRMAAFAEPLACCIHSLDQAKIELSEDVLVIGGGIMGQLHSVLARLKGARVMLVEPDTARRDLAKKLGADIVLDPQAEDVNKKVAELTNGRGPHIIIFTVNSLQLASDYVKLLAPAGRLVYYGSFHPKGEILIDPNNIHYTEKNLTGSFSPTVKAFWTASRLISFGIVDLSHFLSGEFPMDEAQKAFEQSLDPANYRVMINLD